MTNEQFVARIKAGENVGENMEKLYSQVRRFIHVVASRYRGSGELEDLEQEGFLALYDAVEGYDPAQGVQFLCYAEYWIRQRMQRYLQQNGSCLCMSVYRQERNQRYKRICNSFQLKNGREPSEREMARLMDITPEQVREIKKNACMANLMSLDAPVKGIDGGEDAVIGELVADSVNLEETVLDQVQHEQFCAALWECVDSLEGRQPEVIRKKYQEGRTIAAIGADYGVTAEAIRQVERKALRALRGGRNRKKLLPFMELYGMALTGNGVERFNRTWTSSTERAALWDLEREEEYQKHLEWLEKYRGEV